MPNVERPCKYNVREKHFNELTKVTCFNRRIFNPLRIGLDEEKSEHDLEQEAICREINKRNRPLKDRSNRTDSVKRAKDKAFEIAFANDFQYFVTFTLDQTRIDRYDVKIITSKLNTWLKNKVQRRNYQYLIIPEYHKDKAIHFHGLLNGDLDLMDSGKQTKNGQTIFNTDDWSYGFSTVMEIYGVKAQCVNYVMKYVTKESKKIFGKHYLSGGKGLIREVPTTYDNIPFDQFQGELYGIPDANALVKYRTDAWLEITDDDSSPFD